MWLSVWSEDPEAATDVSKRNLYLGVYAALGFLQVIFSTFQYIRFTIGLPPFKSRDYCTKQCVVRISDIQIRKSEINKKT